LIGIERRMVAAITGARVQLAAVDVELHPATELPQP
jgi:hypothetical protein